MKTHVFRCRFGWTVHFSSQLQVQCPDINASFPFRGYWLLSFERRKLNSTETTKQMNRRKGIRQLIRNHTPLLILAFCAFHELIFAQSPQLNEWECDPRCTMISLGPALFITTLLDNERLIKGTYFSGASWEEPRNVVVKLAYHM